MTLNTTVFVFFKWYLLFCYIVYSTIVFFFTTSTDDLFFEPITVITKKSAVKRCECIILLFSFVPFLIEHKSVSNKMRPYEAFVQAFIMQTIRILCNIKTWCNKQIEIIRNHCRSWHSLSDREDSLLFRVSSCVQLKHRWRNSQKTNTEETAT